MLQGWVRSVMSRDIVNRCLGTLCLTSRVCRSPARVPAPPASACPERLDCGEAEDPLGTLVEELLEGRAELPQGVAAMPSGDRPTIGRGQACRLAVSSTPSRPSTSMKAGVGAGCSAGRT